jgi:hypothetical protein
LLGPEGTADRDEISNAEDIANRGVMQTKQYGCGSNMPSTSGGWQYMGRTIIAQSEKWATGDGGIVGEIDCTTEPLQTARPVKSVHPSGVV